MDEEKKPTPSDAGDENSRKGTPAPEPAAEEPSREESPPKRPSRPPRKKGPAYEDLEEDDLAEALQEYLGEDLLSAQSFLKQNIYTVNWKRLVETMVFLKEDHDFDYLVDLTALDYLGDEDRWCLVYHLFSLQQAPGPSQVAFWRSRGGPLREFDLEIGGLDGTRGL